MAVLVALVIIVIVSILGFGVWFLDVCPKPSWITLPFFGPVCVQIYSNPFSRFRIPSVLFLSARQNRTFRRVFLTKIHCFPTINFLRLFLNEDGRIRKKRLSKLHYRFRRYSTLPKTVLLESQYLQSNDDLLQILA